MGQMVLAVAAGNAQLTINGDPFDNNSGNTTIIFHQHYPQQRRRTLAAMLSSQHTLEVLW
jgi:hypothetical protein